MASLTTTPAGNYGRVATYAGCLTVSSVNNERSQHLKNGVESRPCCTLDHAGQPRNRVCRAKPDALHVWVDAEGVRSLMQVHALRGYMHFRAQHVSLLLITGVPLALLQLRPSQT